MDLDLQAFLDSYKLENTANAIMIDGGLPLSDEAEKAYVKWCIKNGYKRPKKRSILKR